MTVVLETFVRVDGPKKGAMARVVHDGAEVLKTRPEKVWWRNRGLSGWFLSP